MSLDCRVSSAKAGSALISHCLHRITGCNLCSHTFPYLTVSWCFYFLMLEPSQHSNLCYKCLLIFKCWLPFLHIVTSTVQLHFTSHCCISLRYPPTFHSRAVLSTLHCPWVMGRLPVASAKGISQKQDEYRGGHEVWKQLVGWGHSFLVQPENCTLTLTFIFCPEPETRRNAFILSPFYTYYLNHINYSISAVILKI